MCTCSVAFSVFCVFWYGRCIYHLSGVPMNYHHHSWFPHVIHNSPRHHWRSGFGIIERQVRFSSRQNKTQSNAVFALKLMYTSPWDRTPEKLYVNDVYNWTSSYDAQNITTLGSTYLLAHPQNIFEQVTWLYLHEHHIITT